MSSHSPLRKRLAHRHPLSPRNGRPSPRSAAAAAAAAKEVSQLKREMAQLRATNLSLSETVVDLKFRLAELESESLRTPSPASNVDFAALTPFGASTPCDFARRWAESSPEEDGEQSATSFSSSPASDATFHSARSPVCRREDVATLGLREWLRTISTPPQLGATAVAESESFSAAGTGASVLDSLSEGVRDDVIERFGELLPQREASPPPAPPTPSVRLVSGTTWTPGGFVRPRVSPAELLGSAARDERVRLRPREHDAVSKEELFSRCRHNRLGALRAELDRHNVDVRDDALNTPLIVAAQNGLRGVAKLCLSRGADIDAQNARGNTALHFALAYNYCPVAQLLIERGADTTIRNHGGLTAYEGL